MPLNPKLRMEEVTAEIVQKKKTSLAQIDWSNPRNRAGLVRQVLSPKLLCFPSSYQ